MKLAGSLLACSLLAYQAQAAWQESKFDPPWCGTTNNIGCWLPINVSATSQTKTGPLIINGTFVGTSDIFAGKLGIGPGAFTSPDPTAVLDVDGQIRIRGGEAAANKILTATGGTGLSKWILYQRLSSLSQDTVNPGVILTPNPVTDIGTVGVDSGYIQRRVTTTCPILIDLTTTQMYSIAQTGTASCRVARVSLTAGSGLLASPANPITNTGTLTIDPAYTQRRLTNVPCPAGQTIYSVAQDGAASCRSNAITISLTPGTSPSGLTFNPNPITNTGTIAVNYAEAQRRVSGTPCPFGQTISTIAQDGTATCASSIISITAGSGLLASPVNPITNTGTLTIDPAYTQRRVIESCPTGGVIAKIYEDGQVICRTALGLMEP